MPLYPLNHKPPPTSHSTTLSCLLILDKLLLLLSSVKKRSDHLHTNIYGILQSQCTCVYHLIASTKLRVQLCSVLYIKPNIIMQLVILHFIITKVLFCYLFMTLFRDTAFVEQTIDKNDSFYFAFQRFYIRLYLV